MDLKSFVKSLEGDREREAFAQRCGTTLGHLKNVMYGYKPCATDLAVNIERETGRAVTRKDLRSDWEKHWPELLEQSETAHTQASDATDTPRELPERRDHSAAAVMAPSLIGHSGDANDRAPQVDSDSTRGN